MPPEGDARAGGPACVRRLRVCHLIHALHGGGAEQALLELARAAPGAGLELSVLSLTAAAQGRYADRLRALDVPVLELDLPSRWDARALRRALAAVRAAGPDLVHTHLKHADLVGAFVARRLGLPMVSTLHLLEDRPGAQDRAKSWLAGQARMRIADLTIAVSDALRLWYVDRFRADPHRVVTLRNGVAPPDRLGPRATTELRASLGVRADAVLVAMVGLLRPGKGHADLLAALQRVPAATRLHVLIVGDGELEPALRRAAADLPVPVTFTGYRTDVPALLEATDLVVHPSHFDALPTSLIEALAAGRPIVATAVGGIPEIVTPDAGRLVPPGTPGALAGALLELAADPAARARLGTAGRRRYEQEFEAGAWAARLHGHYRRVLATG